MTSSALKIENLRKSYRDPRTGVVKDALKGIDLEIPQGSFFGLLGPNGAGKSTLINIIADLTVKTSGKIWLNGHDLDTDKQKAKFTVGIVPQELMLDPFFPIDEMLEYQAGYYGVPPEKRRTKEILERLALGDKARLNSRRLSGGMRRRVLIAKALVHAPSLLILDEPTAGVDVDLRHRLWDYVRELNRQGTTILLTTHYLEEAETLCDRVAIINHGQIIACDETQNLVGRMDERRMMLTFDREITEIPASFRHLNATLRAPNAVQVCYHANETPIESILDAARNSGFALKDLSSEQADLEDIFRQLTAA